MAEVGLIQFVRAAGRSARTQQTQALLLGVTFNLYRLRMRLRFARPLL